MAFDIKDDDFESFIREYVEEVVNEFTGAGAAPGYTLPLGMAMDPESLTLKGKWKKKKKRKVNEAELPTGANLRDLGMKALAGDVESKIPLMDALLEQGNEEASEDIRQSMDDSKSRQLKMSYLQRGLQRAGLSMEENLPWISFDDPSGNKRRIERYLKSIIHVAGFSPSRANTPSFRQDAFGAILTIVPIREYDEIRAELSAIHDWDEAAVANGEEDDSAIIVSDAVTLTTFGSRRTTYEQITYTSFLHAIHELPNDLEEIETESYAMQAVPPPT